MKISFDGLRKNIADDFNELVKQIFQTLEDQDVEDLREHVGKLRGSLGGLMCCYDSNQIPDDFNDLSDEINLSNL